jgi:hypothetical protein
MMFAIRIKPAGANGIIAHRVGGITTKQPKPIIMKTIVSAIGIAALGYSLPLAAQTTETETSTDVTRNADGSVTRTETTTTTFTPESRKKVVTYFEEHKSKPYGLPPGWTTKLKIKKIPAAWRTTRITPGVVITEQEREYLMAAPEELVTVLPPPTADVRYYVAGSNVVAVDKEYKIVDSLHIPSIKITVDD